MGRIVAPFGVQGWVKVEPYTEAPQNLCGYQRWWIAAAGAWQDVEIEQSRAQNGMVVAKLAGCEDRDAAAGFKGRDVAVARAELPEAKANEFYWSDLIGLNVRNMQAQELGSVTSVIGTGANDVLVVQAGEHASESGAYGSARERLIPFIANVVKNVDLAGGVIEVEWGEDY